MTCPISAGWQTTGGNERSRSVTMSATYFHSLRATVMVVSITWLRSADIFSSRPGWAKSFMARTILEMRSTPSSVCSMATGISDTR